jgi:uncharacterized membrane protein
MWLALTLSACAPVPPAPVVRAPPAAARVVGPPLRLVGTEPFWGVLLKDGSLSFDGVDRGAIIAPIASVEVRSPTIIYRTAPPSVVLPVAVTATVTPGVCSDGMSDRTYPYAATVEINYAGAAPPATLTGCAGPESLFERPPAP